MSTQKDLTSKKGSRTLKRTSRRTIRDRSTSLWREETPSRSASRSKKLSASRKIKKMDKNRSKADRDCRKKEQAIIKKPASPHNTTQYIISANSRCLETPSIYTHHQDRFEHDFQHHAMAGSMMDFMKNDFMEKSSPLVEEATQETQDKSIETFQGLLTVSNGSFWKADERQSTVKSENSGLDTDLCLNLADRDEKESDPYSHYLRQAESGEDLESLVRQLVGVLAQKDREIKILKSKDQTHGRFVIEKR